MEVSQTLSAQHEESQQESYEFHEGNETYGLYEKGRIKDGYSQIYDKVNCCTFCGKIVQSKISRHILTHRDEARVMEVLT